MEKNWKILTGDAETMLKELADNSIQCCITSPPYYGLRDYGTGHWEGGDPTCPHYRASKINESNATGHKGMGEAGQAVGDAIYKTVCPLCGAVRVDEQIGLEESPEEYVERLVKVFREIKRVLKDDGTVWLNIGDSYMSGGGASRHLGYADPKYPNGRNGGFIEPTAFKHPTIKPKDMIGIPWMLAFALRADGWYLRQDIIWAKTNPMPESVRDRCVKSHEYIFLLSKSPNYKFNYEDIQEIAITNEHRPAGVVRDRIFDYDSKRNNNPEAYNPKGIKVGGNKCEGSNDSHSQMYNGNIYEPTGKRNKRDVWTVGVNSYKEAHFATFPEELITPCILAGTDEDDLILDPFSGSGTTGVGALHNRRKYIGIDLNPEYVELASTRLDRVSAEMGKTRLW